MALVPYGGGGDPNGRKPSFMPVDWERRRAMLAVKSDRLTTTSRTVRYGTDRETWNQQCRIANGSRRTDIALGHRIQDVEKVKEMLSDYLEAMHAERSDLLDALDAVTRAREDVGPPSDILDDCIGLRRTRSAEETLDDDVHGELRRARVALDRVADRLHWLEADVERHLATTLDMIAAFESAIRDQETTLGIDRTQLGLTERSPDLGLKLDTIIRQGQGTGSMSEEWYEEQMTALAAQARDVLGQSKWLRRSAHHHLTQTRQEQTSVHEAVRYSLRKSVHRLEQAVRNLLCQQDSLQRELSALEANIVTAEGHRHDMTLPMRLAHTRLDNRLDRPERCHDWAQRSLESQVDVLGTAFVAMDHRLDRSRSTKEQMERHLDDVRKELNRKSAALDIDRKCLDMTDRIAETMRHEDAVAGRPRYRMDFPIPIMTSNERT